MNATRHPDVARFEAIERDVTTDRFAFAPPAVVTACALAMHRLGETLVTVAARLDVLALNRATYLGLFAPATERDLDQAMEIFRRAGVPRFFVQLAPGARPAELPRWLEARGFVRYNHWARLHRATTGLPPLPAAPRVEQIGAAGADAFDEIVGTAFGWREKAPGWAAGPIGRPGWQHYLAYDGDRPIATAAMRIADGAAWFGFAATRPEARRGGAQSALIARRLHDAAALGCPLAVVETAEDLPEKPAPSFHNLRRLGFQHDYLLENWIHPAPAAAG